ncbi:MAG: hypothetical protein JST11_05675 [Acidobacteria bacterium]|nr:hypothetical protein [Acidobacteriota bacterium]
MAQPETGLDYFGARYFSSAQGRFTSTDPVIMGPHKVTNPKRIRQAIENFEKGK